MDADKKKTALRMIPYGIYVMTAADVGGSTISGEPCRTGSNGAPLLQNAPAAVECTLVEIVERGDHRIFVDEVVDAHVAKQPEGRADDATLWMRELRDNVFYGG